MFLLTVNHYLALSGVLFAIGTAGVFLRRNLITMLLSIEIMLNAVNLTFVAVGRYKGSVDGQIIKRSKTPSTNPSMTPCTSGCKPARRNE